MIYGESSDQLTNEVEAITDGPIRTENFKSQTEYNVLKYCIVIAVFEKLTFEMHTIDIQVAGLNSYVKKNKLYRG